MVWEQGEKHIYIQRIQCAAVQPSQPPACNATSSHCPGPSHSYSQRSFQSTCPCCLYRPSPTSLGWTIISSGCTTWRNPSSAWTSMMWTCQTRCSCSTKPGHSATTTAWPARPLMSSASVQHIPAQMLPSSSEPVIQLAIPIAWSAQHCGCRGPGYCCRLGSPGAPWLNAGRQRC
jgi:hypothetical protein